MEGYDVVRCLFCTTGKEKSVVETIHRNGWGRAIFPLQFNFRWTKGERIERLRPLLPGYVFVYSDCEQVSYDKLSAVNHIIRVLAYDVGQNALTGRDLEFADWIWRQNGQIGAMKALQIGDRIEITDDLFKELRGTIVRMDRRRKTFQVLLDGMGAIQKLWLTYKVVEKQGI